MGDSLSYYNGGVWEEVARLAPEGAVGRIETVMKGGAPLARLLPMARAALTDLGPKEETGRRRVCVLQVRARELVRMHVRTHAPRVLA